MEYSEEMGLTLTENREVFILDWWNKNSTLKERQHLCSLLGWSSDIAEGEASLAWFHGDEMNELLACSYEQIDKCKEKI